MHTFHDTVQQAQDVLHDSVSSIQASLHALGDSIQNLPSDVKSSIRHGYEQLQVRWRKMFMNLFSGC